LVCSTQPNFARPSTLALAAAVTNAGGIGFLAAGRLLAEELADAIIATRNLTSGALGVNLFVPQPTVVLKEQLDAFQAALAPQAELYGVALGEPRHDDDEWDAKVEVVCDLRPEAVSFTFGVPSAEQRRRLGGVGILQLATVTKEQEAVIAVGRGVDALSIRRCTTVSMPMPPMRRCILKTG
jgi:nitronate monooxygenase